MLKIAHRGFQKIHPENSLSAIKHAMKMNFDGIEFDVRASYDGQLYIIHDKRLNRTTNLRGRIARKHSISLAECRLKNGEKISLLDTILKTLQKYKGMIFLEYKGIGHEKKIYSLVKKYGLEKRTIITQFNFESLKIFRKLDRRLQLFFENTILLEKDLDNAKAIGCIGVSSHPMFMTREMVRQAHKRKMKVIPYAHWLFYKKSENVIKRSKALGADGVFVNY